MSTLALVAVVVSLASSVPQASPAPGAARGAAGSAPEQTMDPPGAGSARPPAPPGDGRFDAYYIGHSLNSDIPDMVAALWKASGAPHPFRFKEQFIPGAPLRWQWQEQERPRDKRSTQEPTFMGHWFDELPSGGWDALVMVDSVPRGVPMMPETLDYAGRFIEALGPANPSACIFIYEPWHCLASGTPAGCSHDTLETNPTSTLPWRERLKRDAAMWDDLVAALRAKFPAREISLIPAGRALGQLADEAAAGTIPGFAAIDAFFDDEIHLNPYGKYFVACVHYACLSGRSPVGLPWAITDRWVRSYWDTPNWQGKVWSPPDPKAVRALQELAAKVTKVKAAAGPDLPP